MDTIIFLLYAIIFACIWYVFNQYFKDYNSKEKRHSYLQKWKVDFSLKDKNLSKNDIKHMVSMAMGQISNEESVKLFSTNDPKSPYVFFVFFIFSMISIIYFLRDNKRVKND